MGRKKKKDVREVLCIVCGLEKDIEECKVFNNGYVCGDCQKSQAFESLKEKIK